MPEATGPDAQTIGAVYAQQQDGGVLHLVLARPAKKNALTLPMFCALAAGLQQAQGDAGVAALLLHGEGGNFTAGHDLAAFSGWPQAPDDPVPACMHALTRNSKPLVMAVDGVAIGFGATALLHADWVCVTPDARLRFPFVDLGIGPEAASSLLLVDCVGRQRARRLMLGGETFSGRDAFEWGLVAELCAPGDLLQQADARARALGAKPQPNYGRMRAALSASQDDVAQRIDEEIAAINVAVAAKAVQRV